MKKIIFSLFACLQVFFVQAQTYDCGSYIDYASLTPEQKLQLEQSFEYSQNLNLATLATESSETALASETGLNINYLPNDSNLI